MKNLNFISKLLFVALFSTFILSCSNQSLSVVQTTECGFTNVTQADIDNFVIRSYNFSLGMLKNPEILTEYENTKLMTSIPESFAINNLKMNFSLLNDPIFSSIANQIKANPTLEDCLIQRALDLGLEAQLEREIGSISLRKGCSGWKVFGHVIKAAAAVAGGCSTGIGCVAGAAVAIAEGVEAYCCFHC
ncbi:MAG TPA: hypothetical protein PKD16_07275 [Saprospiraceae bacterium]|jgi:hypothetical protein|nr:hypothetical protein [Saprospiraceae bacterium]HMT69945.1 hypothetical protein [Saprospiraceae bacterium]